MSDKSVSRRKFLRGGAVAAGATAGAVAAPAVLAQAPKTLKMQGSWGASSIFSEMARQYTDRVEEMSGGKLKIDYLPAGAVVKAFQVQDACADGVLDCLCAQVALGRAVARVRPAGGHGCGVGVPAVGRQRT